MAQTTANTNKRKTPTTQHDPLEPHPHILKGCTPREELRKQLRVTTVKPRDTDPNNPINIGMQYLEPEPDEFNTPKQPSQMSTTANISGLERDKDLVRKLGQKRRLTYNVGTPPIPDYEKPFIWDARSVAAALLLADGTNTPSWIASRVGVNIHILSAWRQHHEFRDRVSQVLISLAEQISGHVLATKEGRARQAIQTLQGLAQIRDERAASANPALYADPDPSNHPNFPFNPEMAQQPGGSTGLLSPQKRIIGTGMNAKEVTDYKVDAELIQAEIAASTYVAKELGQFSEKSEITTNQKLWIDVDMSKI